MQGQTFRLENRWWVRFNKDIPYGGNRIISRTTWVPIDTPEPALKDETWVDFTLNQRIVGSCLSGPVHEEFANINRVL